MSRCILPAGVFLLAILVSGCGGSGSGSGSSDKPAASVNGQSISMGSYNKQIRYLRITSTTGDTDPCGPTAFADLCKQLKRNALETLIGNELVQQYANSHGIKVSNADANTEWTTVLKQQFHGDPAVAHAYARSVGLTVADLKQNARNFLLQQRVMYDVTKHMPLTMPAVRLSTIIVANQVQVGRVRKLLKSGSSFNALAQQLQRDPRSICARQNSLCGERGWLPDELVPAQERTITTAAAGTLTGPFASQTALTLILVEGHDPKYQLSPTQQLAVRQRRFASWLQGQERHATVQRYVAT